MSARKLVLVAILAALVITLIVAFAEGTMQTTIRLPSRYERDGLHHRSRNAALTTRLPAGQIPSVRAGSAKFSTSRTRSEGFNRGLLSSIEYETSSTAMLFTFKTTQHGRGSQISPPRLKTVSRALMAARSSVVSRLRS